MSPGIDVALLPLPGDNALQIQRGRSGFRSISQVVKGDRQVTERAQKLANQRMRREILPLLSRRHPRPNSWNPLRTDFNGPSAYGMKLWLPDALAMEILKTSTLLDRTTDIVLDSVMQAAMNDPEHFVTNILSALMVDG